MKKILFLSYFVFFIFHSASSQNVGIGTVTPAGKLHIKGSADTSQLTIDANATQSNTHPLIRLRNAAGVELIHISSDAIENTFIGLDAGRVNNYVAGTTGYNNTFIGSGTGYSNTTGYTNTANGYRALYLNTTGSSNTANGADALNSNITGNSNTANGSSTLSANIDGYNNTANGSFSLHSNTSGYHNTANGATALFSNITGLQNTAIGSLSLFANTAGDNNTASGSQALYSNTTGINNTADGSASLKINTTGIYNTAIGYGTLSLNVNGNNNTALGTFANVLSGSLTSATAIGFASGVACSNCLVLGGTTTSHANVGINNTTPLTDLHIIQYSDAGGDKIRGIRLQRSVNSNHWRTLIDPSNNYVFEYNDNLYTYINPTTGAYINPSDARLKKDITPLENVLGKVIALTPKKFHYKTNSADDPLLWGFIAQDVQKIFPEFVDVKDDGYLGIAYSNFSIVAIKGIQEQQAEIEELRKEHQAEKGQIKKLHDQNEQTESKYNELKKEVEELKAKINH